MRDEDRVRILHMIDAADAVAQFVAGRSHADLEQDRMLLFALAHAIEILGEAANKVSPEARAAAPQVPWAAIVAMRNRLIHGYFDINTTIVWKTATVEVPELVPLLRALAGTTA
jgi:uncharacterized protein with HEPN domain